MYDDGFPELGADDLIDVEGGGLHADALLQLQLTADQRSLLLLRLSHRLTQPGDTDGETPC